jgi:U3 small nucleolar RNA-associated protein 11
MLLKKIDKLKDELHFIEAKPRAKHTIFVETKEEAKNFSPAEYFDTVPEALERVYNRPRVEDLKNNSLVVNKTIPSLKIVEKEKKRNYRELAARMKRQKEMQSVIEEMQVQKAILV